MTLNAPKGYDLLIEIREGAAHMIAGTYNTYPAKLRTITVACRGNAACFACSVHAEAAESFVVVAAAWALTEAAKSCTKSHTVKVAPRPVVAA